MDFSLRRLSSEAIYFCETAQNRVLRFMLISEYLFWAKVIKITTEIALSLLFLRLEAF